ncbi:hypothetical protein NPIL_581611 [Nephila pilipes]|uniref:Uncharacterized protein n=1 Tax=Nephila pilipes TaxID=299642 RepID=A0A8X6K351_NEPPI|nr:hypothetical protein NPIL_581611 [Nephila pilipes]
MEDVKKLSSNKTKKEKKAWKKLTDSKTNRQSFKSDFLLENTGEAGAKADSHKSPSFQMFKKRRYISRRPTYKTLSVVDPNHFQGISSVSTAVLLEILILSEERSTAEEKKSRNYK